MRRSSGLSPSAAAPSLSKASAFSGRCRAGQQQAAEHQQRRGGDEVRVGHAQRIPEEQLRQALRRVRCQCQQHAEPDQPGYGDRGAGVGSDALVACGQRDHQRGDQRARGRPEQQRGAGQRCQHEPGQQAVGERLRGVGQLLGDHPEAERAAERARQRDLGEGAAVDAGTQRIGEEIEHLHQWSCPWWWCWTVTARPSPRRMISLP